MKRQKKKPKRKKGKAARLYLILFFGISFIAVMALGILLLFLVVDVPDLENFADREVPESTKIYDESGEVLLWEIHGEENRTLIDFNDISLHIKNATLAIEDDSFYSHGGVSIFSIIKAVIADILKGNTRMRGASTITQQLVKNTLLSPERTVSRKVKEMIISMKLERIYSKDTILNFYLNEIPYGSGTYGVEAAAKKFFGESAKDVTLAQAAYLASLPKAPTYFSPYGNNKAKLDARKNLVLVRMKELGVIDDAEYKAAVDEEVAFLPQKREGLRAPHFVMYVRGILNQMYGENYIERAGLEIRTTLNIKLQEKAEEIISVMAKENKKKFNASNAGLIALDPNNGRILVMVGSRDYFDVKNGGNFNVTLARRQPGSAFKPIVYATAFKNGYTPETVVFDLPTDFDNTGFSPYTPSNYDSKFRGPITFREALAQSLNVPSVKVLYLAGLADSLKTAQDFGITTLTDINRYGLTLVLGGGEVSLLELVNAYSAFAHEGLLFKHHAIIEIKDKDGVVIFNEELASRSVLDPNVARTVTDILSDNKARTPTFGPSSPLFFPNKDVAAKTGTTNNYRDAWTIGYSPSIAVGVWAGNNDNSPMEKRVAGFIVTPIWRAFMDYALERIDSGSFTPPDPPDAQKPVLRGIWQGSITYIIDKISGKLATEYTPESQKEERVVRQIHTILHWVDKKNPAGPIPVNPLKDSQYDNWEGPVRTWAEKQGYSDENIGDIVTEFDDVHTPDKFPKITIKELEGRPSFNIAETIVLSPDITRSYPISQIDILIDNNFIRSEKGLVDNIPINFKVLNISGGEHEFLFVVYDSVGNRQEKLYNFSVTSPEI